MLYKSRFKCNIGMPIISASQTTKLSKEIMPVKKLPAKSKRLSLVAKYYLPQTIFNKST